MGIVSAADLDKLSNFEQLVDLLRDKLEWPIGEDYGFDDIVFEYEASELGLKKDETAKIREIHQLRPLATNQPWGIFFISMEDKAIPVTVLRRILKALVVKKRSGAQTADRRAWDKSDLIFAASFGKSGSRELAFIHFSDGKTAGDLPVMKVLGWNAQDTVLKHEYVAGTLRDKLIWPDDTKDIEDWRKTWASAFELRLNEVIKTSKDLAIRLGDLASDIRARVNQLLEAEDDTGPMRAMHAAFRKNLIHDLDDDGFADMFAQTIAYGMLAARISRPMGIIADNLADMVPKTNPFLKELFGNFLKIGGRDKRTGLDFDELGIRDVVDLLNDADMEAVLRDFGDRNPKEDPVIHFYELFLKEYDPKKRMQRGVFYTPRPVVNFIVRGVDEILRTEFDLPLGLADTSTWAEVAAWNDRITIPAHVKPDAPFVQILDPATGTGTFLVEVIDLIHKRMEEHWKGQGKSADEIKAAWNAYVPAHLLPRLTAFELMMAPYTIAHMKVGLKLSETGYTFGSDERARIFLTNALEPARDLDMEFIFMSEALAHEAQAANDAKAKTPFTVVIGNPPYAGHSSNPAKDAKGRLTFAGEVIEDFFRFAGGPLGEKQPKWLLDDYVKFIGLARRRLSLSEHGVLGFITNHGYVDNPTFRGFRESMIGSFSRLSVLNLNGSVKKRSSQRQVDENVFDIEQGVSILFGAKIDVGDKRTSYASLLASREEKFDRLLESGYGTFGFRPVNPAPPFLAFDRSIGLLDSEWNSAKSVSALMQVNSLGVVTGRDALSCDFSKDTLEDRFRVFSDRSMSNEKIASDFGIKDAGGYVLAKRRPIAFTELADQVVKKCFFRNFDYRWIIFSRSLLTADQNGVMKHLVDGASECLVSTRTVETGTFNHAIAASHLVVNHALSVKEANYVLPLWLKPSAGESHRRPNIDRAWGLGVGEASGLVYEDGIPRGEQKSFGPDFHRQKAEQLGLLDTRWDGRGDLQQTLGPRDLFDYIYAVLHSPGYRARYAEFLKSDFPRIPTPKDRATFADLVALGRQLVALHLLRPDEAPGLETPGIRFAGTGEARVEKGFPKYENGKVMINGSHWFEDVQKATWEFHVGGYQVCDKWLKDRAGKGGKKPSPGRILTDEDILHYRRVVVALTETQRLMVEIDEVIEKHGGWPGAFEVAE
ncbi:type ISP restriction/modification enzyme [Roseovarius sp.]|uniref:type ISP restriction/modification enzyme n=1 Tax=Roseovarius sp. TaxID=1486281 RepID=UPI0035615F9D